MDISGQGYNNWIFMSTHYWDEDPQGLWTLGLENKGYYFNTGESRLLLQGCSCGLGPATVAKTPPPTEGPRGFLGKTMQQAFCHTECYLEDGRVPAASA